MATTTRNKHKQIVEEAERQKEAEKIKEFEENERETERFEETSESEIGSDYEAQTDILSEESCETEEISFHIISDNESNREADININKKSLKKRKPPSKITKP